MFPSLKKTPVTATLLLLIAAMFGWESVQSYLNHHAALDDSVLVALGALTADALRNGEYWRLLTVMFLHANVLHWLANSWALYQLGSAYESLFGARRFLVIYFGTGVCASIGSAIALPAGGASVGASGAILGVLGAFIFSITRSPWRQERWARSLVAQLVFWAVVNVVIGFEFEQIDNAAHLTGLASGLLLGNLPQRIPPPPPSDEVIDVKPSS